jgi:hypothetical protein
MLAGITSRGCVLNSLIWMIKEVYLPCSGGRKDEDKNG